MLNVREVFVLALPSHERYCLFPNRAQVMGKTPHHLQQEALVESRVQAH